MHCASLGCIKEENELQSGKVGTFARPGKFARGGALNIRLRTMCDQKDPAFCGRSHPMTPILPFVTQRPHIFSLSPKDPMFLKFLSHPMIKLVILPFFPRFLGILVLLVCH